MNLSQLKPPAGQKHKKQRIGQAWAPAAARLPAAEPRAPSPISGYSRMRGFEGGQMPLHRRLPKRGFTNIFKKQFAIVNLGGWRSWKATLSRRQRCWSWASSTSWRRPEGSGLGRA